MAQLRNIQTFLYRVTFNLLKYCEEGDSKLSFRNSLFFNNLTSLRSDIDLTVIGEKDDHIRETIKNINHLKIILPYIGEVNAYNKSFVDKFIPFANEFELKRDPALKSFYEQSSVNSHSQKVVFIARMLLANRKKHFKHKKWNFYFKHIQEKAPQSYTDVMSFLGLKDFKDLDNHIAFNPIQHLTESLQNRTKENFLLQISDLSEEEKEILIENLKWEIFGVCSQLHVINNKNGVCAHFNNIKDILESLKSPLVHDLEGLIFDISQREQIY